MIEVAIYDPFKLLLLFGVIKSLLQSRFILLIHKYIY